MRSSKLASVMPIVALVETYSSVANCACAGPWAWAWAWAWAAMLEHVALALQSDPRLASYLSAYCSLLSITLILSLSLSLTLLPARSAHTAPS